MKYFMLSILKIVYFENCANLFSTEIKKEKRIGGVF